MRRRKGKWQMADMGASNRGESKSTDPNFRGFIRFLRGSIFACRSCENMGVNLAQSVVARQRILTNFLVEKMPIVS